MKLKKPVTRKRSISSSAESATDDGMTAPATVKKLGEAELNVTIHEGRNRQVRRMAETIGNEVVALQRDFAGSLKLGRLGIGKFRLLGTNARWKEALERYRRWLIQRQKACGSRRSAARSRRRTTPTGSLSATEELIREIISVNDLEPDRMISAIFTTTEDLDAEFPAAAARRMGLNEVPLMCAREIPVPGAMPG